MSRIASLFGMATAVLAMPAAAQDIAAEPSYGEMALQSGFDDDPRMVELQSGGPVDAGALNASCAGMIASAPDVALTFNPENAVRDDLPLIISVDAASDTTLVIRAPDGQWQCDDDGGNKGNNPSIRLAEPQAGRYLIWVGTYGGGASDFHPATLHISEVTSE